MASVVAVRVAPDADEPAAAELRVTVEVAGHPYDMLLDTGAGTSRLPDDPVTHGFEPGAPEADDPGRGVFGSSSTADRVVIPHLRLGDITVTGFVVDLSRPDSGEPPAILGLDVLRHHRLDLRVEQQTLTLDGADPVDEFRALTLSSRGHPYLEVTWGGVTASAIWDTGASVSVVDAEFARRHPQLFGERGAAVGIDSQGEEQEVPMVTMGACEIGGRVFGPSVAAVAPIAGIQREGDPPFDLIVGYPILRQADWCLDLPSARWGFL